MRRFDTPYIADWFAISLRWMVLIGLVGAPAAIFGIGYTAEYDGRPGILPRDETGTSPNLAPRGTLAQDPCAVT